MAEIYGGRATPMGNKSSWAPFAIGLAVVLALLIALAIWR
jgi:hypothetical protein